MNTPPRFPPGPPPTMQPPPKKGLSGCAIAAIVGVVIAVVSIPAIAILAAIALPAYQQYVVRSQIASLLPKLEPLQQAIDEYQASHGTCPPDNAAVGVSPTLSYVIGGNNTRFGNVQVSTSQEGRCAINIMLYGVPPQPSSAGMTLESEGGRWRCRSTLDDTVLPPQCRAGNPATP